MPKYEVSLGRERAFDATLIVTARDEAEAERKALARVTDDDFEEGDWESETQVLEVLEL